MTVAQKIPISFTKGKRLINIKYSIVKGKYLYLSLLGRFID